MALLPCLFLILASAVAGAPVKPEPADLVLYGGNVVTLADSDHPAHATAVAVREGRIVFVGDDRGVRAFEDMGTEVIFLNGATVIPGFHDSHAHLYGLGKALAEIDLVDTASAAEAAGKVAAALAETPEGTWLQGRGWDQNDWPVQEYPTRRMLDDVTGARPAYLRRIDGHAAWVNTAALNAAGITRDTADPEGGAILRDRYGVPTGILIDNAADLVGDIIPPVPDEEIRRRIRLAQEHCLAHGITAVTTAGLTWERAQIYLDMAARGELELRVFGMYDDIPETLERGLAAGPVFTPDGMFTVRMVKLYADGALGSRGALLHRSYSDRPGERGLQVTPTAHLREVAAGAASNGFQVCTHAIGDAANTLMLDLYQEVLAAQGLQDYRWRIEHAQILTPDDIPRFAELGVIAAMQPVHCTSDMDWADERVGAARLKGAYAWRSLLDTGAHLCWGTDFPVERVDPLAGLYSARTRTHHDGSPAGGWQPQETVDAATALRLYTLGSAHAVFREDDLGRIQTGYTADLTVLDRDPVAGPPGELLQTKVLATVVNGQVVFRDF